MDDLQERTKAWLGHGCPMPALYGDDGEMQCPCGVDWKRDVWPEIVRKVVRRARAGDVVEGTVRALRRRASELNDPAYDSAADYLATRASLVAEGLSDG